MNYIIAVLAPVLAVSAFIYYETGDTRSETAAQEEVTPHEPENDESVGELRVSHTAEKQTLFEAASEMAAKVGGVVVCDTDSKAKLEIMSVFIHLIDMPVKDAMDNLALVGAMSVHISGSDIIFDQIGRAHV